MTITELLEAHDYRVVEEEFEKHGKVNTVVCLCGNRYGLFATHRRHQAEVLEQHMQEREAQAWEDCSDAWQDALNQDRFNPEEHLPPNPYRKESSDGR